MLSPGFAGPAPRLSSTDVGGGLRVDYEGSRSQHDCSANYDLATYAEEVLRPIARICAEHDLPQPTVFSESGRAMTAHHAVLIADVIEQEQPFVEVGTLVSNGGDLLQRLRDLRYVHFDPKQMMETYLRRMREQGLGEAFIDSCYRELRVGRSLRVVFYSDK